MMMKSEEADLGLIASDASRLFLAYRSLVDSSGFPVDRRDHMHIVVVIGYCDQALMERDFRLNSRLQNETLLKLYCDMAQTLFSISQTGSTSAAKKAGDKHGVIHRVRKYHLQNQLAMQPL